MFQNGMLLNTHNDYEKLNVSVYAPVTTTQKNPSQTCEVSENFSLCNKYHVECRFKKCNLGLKYQTCAAPKAPRAASQITALNNRVIQINGITVTKGDILVNGGIVHILEKPLYPTF